MKMKLITCILQKTPLDSMLCYEEMCKPDGLFECQESIQSNISWHIDGSQ